MMKSKILEIIRRMPNEERFEIIEFALKLVREDVSKPNLDRTKLSLSRATEVMKEFYEPGNELVEFTDLDTEDFYEYRDYALRAGLVIQCRSNNW